MSSCKVCQNANDEDRGIKFATINFIPDVTDDVWDEINKTNAGIVHPVTFYVIDFDTRTFFLMNR